MSPPGFGGGGPYGSGGGKGEVVGRGGEQVQSQSILRTLALNFFF